MAKAISYDSTMLEFMELFRQKSPSMARYLILYISDNGS